MLKAITLMFVLLIALNITGISLKDGLND